MMKVTRYSASGPTHSSGILAMSVVMWNVTPSIRLLGTNASTVHFAIRAQVGGGSIGGPAAGTALVLAPAFGPCGDSPPVRAVPTACRAAFAPASESAAPGGTPSGFTAARPQSAISPISPTNPAAHSHVCTPCVMFGSMKIG